MKAHRHTINLVLYLVQLVLSFYLLAQLLSKGLTPVPRHVVNFAGMLALAGVYFYNRQVFTLLLGLVLLAGNFTGLSAFETISWQSLFFNIGSFSIPLYWGAPFYSLLLAIYLAANKGFYIGFGTAAYWKDFRTRTEDLVMTYTVANADEQEAAQEDRGESL